MSTWDLGVILDLNHKTQRGCLKNYGVNILPMHETLGKRTHSKIGWVLQMQIFWYLTTILVIQQLYLCFLQLTFNFDFQKLSGCPKISLFSCEIATKTNQKIFIYQSVLHKIVPKAHDYFYISKLKGVITHITCFVLAIISF